MKINNDTIEKHAGRVVMALFAKNVRQATSYLSPEFVITATRRFPIDRRMKSQDFVIKIGAPNYRQREFIATCRRTGVAFPLREPQLKFYDQKGKRIR